MVILGEGLRTVLAHPSKAGAAVVSVGTVVNVSLSCLFPEILSGFLVGSASGSLGFLPSNKQVFSCHVAFGHPSSVVGILVGKRMAWR